MDTAAIGIFDSGLGGLTVARAVADALPHESILYIGDTARCPYGPRDAAQVRAFSAAIANHLVAAGVKVIVIACNTATSAALEMLQQTLPVPVIGVIQPGARAAVRATRKRRVGVIGTEGTVNSGAYPAAVAALDAGISVYSQATPALVDIVELGLTHTDADTPNKVWLSQEFYDLAGDYLEPLLAADIDALILGCTHYPVIARPLAFLAGDDVVLISSADEVAHEVKQTLRRRHQLTDAPADDTGGYVPARRFLTTGDVDTFRELGSRIYGADLVQVEQITL
ncbi:MAG: glutamate racemase [Actinomycetes bacterium]|jgi:glutamate racemase|nr:glutamate racemase [Actinomycetes bacterium]